MGLWEIVSTAIRVYVSNANALFLIVAVLAVPVTILLTLLITAALPDELVNFDPARGEDALSGLTVSDFRSLIVVGLIGGVLGFVISMVAIGACFVVVGEALAGRSIGWTDAIRSALSKVASLIWIPLLVGLLILGGLIAGAILIGALAAVVEALAVIVGIGLLCAFVYVAVLWSLAVPALMAEDVRGTRALARSGELIQGRWWPTLGVYLIAFVIILVVSLVLDAIFGAPEGRTGTDLVVALIGGAISQILVTPFQAAVAGVVYFDLRARKEQSQPAMPETAGGHPGQMAPPPPPPPNL